MNLNGVWLGPVLFLHHHPSETGEEGKAQVLLEANKQQTLQDPVKHLPEDEAHLCGISWLKT